MLKRIFLALIISCFSISLAPSFGQAEPIITNHLNDLLFKAVYQDNLTLTQSAIKKGADVNNAKHNPLKIAIENKNLEIVQLLLDKGADPNQYIDEGTVFNTTPLLEAIAQQDIHIIKLLVKNGANINLPSHHYADEKVTGKSPLMYAVFFVQNRTGTAIVEYLLRNGADVNYTTNAGYSVLMTAANCDDFSGKRKVTYGIGQKLLRKGANVNMQTQDGKNALDYAKEQNYTKMVELLSDITEK